MDDRQRTDLTPVFVRLAALWIAAGAFFKLFAGTPADLPQVVRDFPLSLDLTFKLAIAVELSITFAALLRPRLAWPAVVALFAVFEVILGMIAMDGSASCGCFGSSVAIPPAVMMGIDGVLLVLVLGSRPWKGEGKAVTPLAAVAVTTLLSFAAPFMVIGNQEIVVPADGEAVATAQDLGNILRYAELHMDTWEGKYIYDTELGVLLAGEIDTVPIDATAVIYRATCDHCALHLEALAMEDDGTRPFILIRVPDDEGAAQVHTMPIGGHVTMLTLPEGPQYLVETPADFQLEGAIVVAPREGIKVDEH